MFSSEAMTAQAANEVKPERREIRDSENSGRIDAVEIREILVEIGFTL